MPLFPLLQPFLQLLRMQRQATLAQQCMGTYCIRGTPLLVPRAGSESVSTGECVPEHLEALVAVVAARYVCDPPKEVCDLVALQVALKLLPQALIRQLGARITQDLEVLRQEPAG